MNKKSMPYNIVKSYTVISPIYMTKSCCIYKIKDINDKSEKILKISDYNKNEFELLNIIKNNNNKYLLTPEYISRKKGMLFVIYPHKTPIISKLKSDKITFNDLINLTLNLCSGIIFLHKQKYLHLDISPDNIYVNDDGTFCIGDYSSVRKSNQKNILHNLYYTPGYSPPEFHIQAPNDITINELSDEYSIAATIISFCQLNKSTNNNEICEDYYDIPEEFIQILKKANSEIQEYRYKSIHEFQKAVLNFQNDHDMRDLNFTLSVESTDKIFNNLKTIPLEKEKVVTQNDKSLAFINSSAFMTIIIILAILLPTFALYNIFFVSHTSNKKYTQTVISNNSVDLKDSCNNNNQQKNLKVCEFDFKENIIASITPEAITKITHIQPDLNSLKIISANNNCVSDITKLSSFPNIEELYLSSNKIKNINSLSELKKLKTLVISANLLEDISPLSKIETLENIDLAGNKKIKNITTLSKIKSLKLLCVNNTNIKKNELISLKKALPKCNIIF